MEENISSTSSESNVSDVGLSNDTKGNSTGNSEMGSPETISSKEPISTEFNLKINGQEIKYKQEDVIAAAQKYYAGEDKLREASNREKAIIERFKTKPWETMTELGLDVDTLAHDRLYEKIRKSRLSPEQVELEELRGRAKDWESQEAEVKLTAEAAMKQEMVESHSNQTAQSILEELPKATDLPQTADTVVRIIGKLKEALGYNKSITVADAIGIIRKEREDVLRWASESDPAALGKILSKQTLAAINKDNIKNFQTQTAENRANGNRSPVLKVNEPVKKQSMSDWLEEQQTKRYGK